MNKYKFTYADIKNLPEEEKEKELKNRCGVLAVECLSTKQLQKKKPRFMVFLDTIIFDSTTETGGQYATATVKTEPIGDGRFRVCDGWGQLSNGIIELLK
mgnify:CR=1 FL=1